MIILTCNKWKIINEIIYILFSCKMLETQCVFHSYSTLQF